MKITTIEAAFGSAILLLSLESCAATVQHRHHHIHPKRIGHGHGHNHIHSDVKPSPNPKYSTRDATLVARNGKKACKFPTDKGLVSITPEAKNAGWAMAPDQECVSGTWCPIACPSGQVSTQWKPGTGYRFPESTYGGIYCNDDGEIEVPFEDKPWCVDGTGTVEAVNKAGKIVSFCQTSLPGYEDMIIPTDVVSTATLAVPDISYWDRTAAHFYVNAPGVSASEGCHWGDESKPVGNWSPYVAGANTIGDGSTFVKLGINPVWEASGLYATKPSFGLKIECPEGGCNGLPCECDGSGVTSNNKDAGAGGSEFCVVTVPKGSKANIVVFNLDGSGADSPKSRSEPESSTSQLPPTSSSTPTTTSVPPTTSTSSAAPSTSTSTSTSTSSAESTTSSSQSRSSSVVSSSSFSAPTSTATFGGVFQEPLTSSSSSSPDEPTSTESPASSTSEAESAATESNKNEGAGQRRGGAAVAGLIVAFVAASYLL
ncbi:beta-glucosidase-domain-containing protein [Durotheca rogersii]|uniref:beta-glucosidase-domain-containing protein n=1 Tax=Durotheca rogersii TaxID=419775 RepID=UPI00221EA08D|nr:beta-glucosidase-domain-containing protein [Durotheca rogersii]KAI5865057.1 beta-glucosidase-domain-containing protein [Durotheca rogersii]